MSFYGKGHGISLSIYLHSTLTVLISFSCRLQDAYAGRCKLAKVVQWMGEVSFGVHLVHMLFVTVTTAFIPTDAWGVRWLVVTVFTLEFLAAVKRLAPCAAAGWMGFR